jgi:hypothetical protein
MSTLLPTNNLEVRTTIPTTTTQIPVVVSGEQEPHRIRQAQDLLRQLQVLLMEGETPGVELLSEALKKAEELSYQAANQNDMDLDSRKVFEDISALLLSARQLGRNKHIEERLKIIYEESQKALESTRGVNVSAATKEATQNVLDYVNAWRPLFYLLMTSRDFRQLLLDTVKITKNVLYNYSEPIAEHTEQKFVEGAPVQEVAGTVKEHVQQKGTPELSDEEWDRIENDVQRVLAQLAKEPTYRQGIERIFSLLDMFHLSLLTTTPQSVTTVPENIHLRRVVTETEDLAAAFSGRETLEQFKWHLRNLVLRVQQNENLHNYLFDLKQFILKAKSEEEVRSQAFKAESKEMAYRGRDLMKELKEDELKPFLNSCNDMLDHIKNDEFLQILRHHAGIVQADLTYVDSQGVTQLDTNMLGKLQASLLPVLAEALKYIPIPRIHSSDIYREFWVDNIALCSYDILPENIRIHMEADTEISVREVEVKSTYTNLVIQLDRLKTEIKDVEFYYLKKTFPSMEERGRATFRICGEGARLTLTYGLTQGPNDANPTFTKGYAHFVISDMSIDFDTASLKHPYLFPAFTSMVKGSIRQQIEDSVEDNLNGFVAKLADMLGESLSQVNRPILSSIEMARNAIKSTQIPEVYEKRREKLE